MMILMVCGIATLFCLSIFALVNIDNLNFKSSKYSSSTKSSKYSSSTKSSKNKKNENASDFYKFYKILHKNKNHVPFSYGIIKFYIPDDLRLD